MQVEVNATYVTVTGTVIFESRAGLLRAQADAPVIFHLQPNTTTPTDDSSNSQNFTTRNGGRRSTNCRHLEAPSTSSRTYEPERQLCANICCTERGSTHVSHLHIHFASW